ncbi:Trans-2-enoyl-CoA reductase, mitochondrial, partial [Armadillidium nasatum]
WIMSLRTILSYIKKETKSLCVLNACSLNSATTWGHRYNFNLNQFSKRCYNTTRETQFKQLLVNSYGEPEEVVSLNVMTLPDIIKGTEVFARVLAAPVNPADINTIQGTYAYKPQFPFVPGNEGVLEVLEVGENVKELKKGDRIIPKLNALGTFRSALVAEEKDFIKIPSDIDPILASTIAVNPCTAYRMIKDYVPLQDGDVIIQNLANSAVGQAVIQIAADKGIKTINIVRPRPDLDKLKDFLESLGATLVIPLPDMRKNKDLLNELPKPRLGFNGVSGKDAAELIRMIEVGGTVVTYGGMARQPLFVPVGELIFRDIIFRGYWMTRWNLQHKDDPERITMLDYLFDLVRRGKFVPPPHELVPIEDFKTALRLAMPAKGMTNRKQILVFN